MAARMAQNPACLIAGRNNAGLAHYEMGIFPTFREVFQNTIRKFSNAISLPADSLIVSADRIRITVRFFVKTAGFSAFLGRNNKEKSGQKSFPEVYPKVLRKKERLFHIYF